MKRAREEDDAGNGRQAEAVKEEPMAKDDPTVKQEPVANGVQGNTADDDEDDKPLLANYKMSRSSKKGSECPYLDTISRQVRSVGEEL